MPARATLTMLIVLGTIGFVIGTTLERRSGENMHESAAQLRSEGRTTAEQRAGGGETSAEHAGEGGAVATPAATTQATHAELRPLGVNVEAVPFVILAAAGSLGLALAAWRRPDAILLLVTIAAAMLVFAVLDAREVVHQADESRTGLATLAGAIAALHLAAALVAARATRRGGLSRQPAR